MTTPPNLSELLGPILPAIPPAAASALPADGVLPFLSPILRQRVKILSSSSTDPWLRLLCYDPAKAPRLAEIAASGNLDPHPVSGEVEVDWDYDAETRYRRIDQETLQALVSLSELGLAFQLVYCVNDAEGGGDGWRVGEITTAEKPAPFSVFGGFPTLDEAERQFQQLQATAKTTSKPVEANGHLAANPSTSVATPPVDDDDDDDGYWAQYDATPANRTPATTRSPAPTSMGGARAGGAAGGSMLAAGGAAGTVADDDDYFAQYDEVQPAMDNYDPEEADAAQQAQIDVPPLGLNSAAAVSAAQRPDEYPPVNGKSPILQPRPESSASSTGSHTVAKLEASAGLQEQSEFGVKQHVSRSIRSLYMLSKASGIDRQEFERLVQTELNLLSLAEDETMS